MSHNNWAGNLNYRVARIHFPETVEHIQEIVRQSQKVKTLGTRHAFNDIADTTGDHISLERMQRIVEIDPKKTEVTVDGGITYGQLCPALHRAGFALHNLASLPHISVAGACSTATHGSGNRNGNLATAVCAIEFVAANGEHVSLLRERDGESFLGAVVNLGGIGVVTQLTLDLVPTFDVRQYVYEKLPLAQLEERFDEIMSSAYSVSLFTDWRGDTINQLWMKHRVESSDSFEAEQTLFGATLATDHRHPIDGISAENCTAQMGDLGAWHTRLPHFRMDFTPSAGEELQSEYFIPREHALAAFDAIRQIHEFISPILLISEIRSIAADDLWMSPCFKRACVAFHFTWRKDWDAVRKVLPKIEEAFESFDARPHWGKLFTMPVSRLLSLYTRVADFRQLLERYDPNDKFRNSFLNSAIFER
jgi:xylitol oxidase